MEDDEGLYAALRKINRAGVVLLENVGVEDRAVLDLARRIAPISHQALFGEVFDIGSQVSGIGGRHWEHVAVCCLYTQVFSSPVYRSVLVVCCQREFAVTVSTGEDNSSPRSSHSWASLRIEATACGGTPGQQTPAGNLVPRGNSFRRFAPDPSTFAG